MLAKLWRPIPKQQVKPWVVWLWPTIAFTVKAKIGARFLDLTPSAGPKNQHQNPCDEHEDADSVNPMHHAQVKIAAAMGSSSPEDLYKIPKEFGHCFGFR
jgi:hypothetical protein